MARFVNTNTRYKYRLTLRTLFAETDAHAPHQLTEATVLNWCAGNGKRLANNSVRSRAQIIGGFLKWCESNALACPPSAMVTGRNTPLRQFRPTYGKVQSKYPARWLTHTEAFQTLIPVTQDGTDIGLRDEIILRLGLLGLRVTEIGELTWGSVQLDTSPPAIGWTGKGYKPRHVVPGTTLVAALRRWSAIYASHADITTESPVICSASGHYGHLRWGKAFAHPRQALHRTITVRAQQAALGHVAPHDLRRSAAGILHRDKSESGAHNFDLLDIQKVLGHSDPATTMRSYLDPMDTGVIERAANVLD